MSPNSRIMTGVPRCSEEDRRAIVRTRGGALSAKRCKRAPGGVDLLQRAMLQRQRNAL